MCAPSDIARNAEVIRTVIGVKEIVDVGKTVRVPPHVAFGLHAGFATRKIRYHASTHAAEQVGTGLSHQGRDRLMAALGWPRASSLETNIWQGRNPDESTNKIQKVRDEECLMKPVPS